MKQLLLVSLTVLASTGACAAEAPSPVRLAIVGLVHDHVRGFIPSLAVHPEVQLVGIVEPDQKLGEEIAAQFHLDPALFAPTLAALRQRSKVEAVATFTSTYDHRRVVEECAAAGLPVMMEKPMAVSLADARAMAAAARQAGVPVVVNYETTWYPSTHGAYGLVHDRRAIGDLRKIVVRDGHSGPARICSSYFLNWLTDPVLDGGGAVADFGCYGADLVTWLMDGRRPDSVFAVLQHFQPDVYPKVDDEATIVLTYPHTQAILQASWNWPYGRKDMELYGQTGAVRLPDRNTLLLREGEAPEKAMALSPLPPDQADSVGYFAAVVRGRVRPTGLSSADVNVIVCEILDAAKESARTGKRIELAPADSR